MSNVYRAQRVNIRTRLSICCHSFISDGSNTACTSFGWLSYLQGYPQSRAKCPRRKIIKRLTGDICISGSCSALTVSSGDSTNGLQSSCWISHCYYTLASSRCWKRQLEKKLFLTRQQFVLILFSLCHIFLCPNSQFHYLARFPGTFLLCVLQIDLWSGPDLSLQLWIFALLPRGKSLLTLLTFFCKTF